MTDVSRKILIENDGALFRGPSVSQPDEVWNPKTGWAPYKGAVPKPVEWGDEISEADAEALMEARGGAEKRIAAE